MPQDRQSRRRDRIPTTGDSSYAWPSDEWRMAISERLATVEVSQDLTTSVATERLAGLSARVTEHDRRLHHGRDRMDELDDRLRDTTREVGRLMTIEPIVERLDRDLSPLPSRMTSLEERHENFTKSFTKLRDALLYAASMALLSLVLSGRMTLDQLGKALGVFAKVFL